MPHPNGTEPYLSARAPAKLRALGTSEALTGSASVGVEILPVGEHCLRATTSGAEAWTQDFRSTGRAAEAATRARLARGLSHGSYLSRALLPAAACAVAPARQRPAPEMRPPNMMRGSLSASVGVPKGKGMRS
jgi:hypothetical protein